MDAEKKVASENRRPWIVDTTLRDGEQAPGVAFCRRDKMDIAGHLDRAGIDELEAGTPVMGTGVQEDIRRIAAMGLGCRLSVWCRARPDDLAAAARCNVSGVHISLPVSSIHLAALGKDRTWVLTRMEQMVQQARMYFDYVSVGAQDATRAEIDLLGRFAAVAQDLGADRLRIADTVGVAHPGSVTALIGKIRQAAPHLPIEFHAHNDLGMASANALTALESGARAVSVTVNGLGERAGNAALEQIAMALSMHDRFACPLDTSRLLSLSRLVARAAGKPVPPDQPVVGDGVFTHESGIHCHAMFRQNRAYEPFDPQLAGHADRRFVLGAHSGTAAIRNLLGRAGIRISHSQARALKPLFAGQM